MSNGIFGGNEALGDTPIKIERFLAPVAAPAPIKIGNFLAPVTTTPKIPIRTLDLSSLKKMLPFDPSKTFATPEQAGGLNTNLLTYVAIGGVALVGAYLLFRKR
jgi:hypothetical protein